ncbi:MAG: response regulator [Clostridia bacterium]|nr:response regulator [Clostridia bacterium]
MKEQSLHAEELMGILKHTTDTVWLITLRDFRVTILKDNMIPHMEGQTMEYGQIHEYYAANHVYSPDLDKWHSMASISSIKKLCLTECRKKQFDMRFRSAQLGFEWHEANIHILEDGQGKPDRILITSIHVNEYKKDSIITKAVESEYDYIVYIEADKNSYVMYTSNRESGTPVPLAASSDYEAEVAMYHRRYVPEEQQEQLTGKLSIAHVQPILRKEGEYVVYCNVIENGVLRDKKMRFSYYDRDSNIWLLTRTDITEIREEKRQKQLLQDALEAATAANRAKSEFLSRMSHDIRTPMNAIIGMTAIAGAHINDQERIADCLGKITTSSRLLLSLINEVLDMAKVESGNIVLSEEEIDLSALVQNVVTMTQPMIDRKGQFFEAHLCDVSNELVIGDSQRLQQVFLNLLSNATKYTPEQGHIFLEIKEKPSHQAGTGCFEFSVTDDGIGMKPDFLERVFEPFERADDEACRKVPGTGLGMSICKNIVEMMGGTLEVESQYGSGTTFTATVYLRLQEQPDWDENRLAGLPVLVVDDDEMICLDVCKQLNTIGMDTDYAPGGREAVRLVVDAHNRGRDYFAVIIDLRMPEMDGIETTRQIRAHVGYHMPIIMISAYDWSEYEDEAIKAGVNDFIVKPLFQSRLIYKLKQVILKEPQQLPHEYTALPMRRYHGKRVLVVEDNELNSEIAVELLTSLNLEVETAENGSIAADMVRNHPEHYYDLIFMDMRMPVMDGCQATAVIRNLDLEYVKKLPIVAMTANAFADDMERTRQAGMDGHLSKPIDMELLAQTLDRWLL